jgi:UDP-N-acetylmuramate dehydrogenase
MKILRDVPLGKFNTFGIDAHAKAFASFQNENELTEIFEEHGGKTNNMLILGGGSNLLFTKDFDGLILKNEIGGISLLEEDSNHYYVTAGAGENWHHFVLKCIENEWAGLENLSLIPGNVGASPMQNIGAYGVEIKDRFSHLEAFNIESGKVEVFDSESCAFGYRESVFKRAARGKYIILRVTYKLLKAPEFHTSYGAIREELDKMGVKKLSIKAISDAVIKIRQSKLPDPAKLGNAGSFFKNPVVDEKVWLEIERNHPDIPHYPAGDGKVKLAAGWLIEHAGWKGKRIGNCGMHAKQALVLVNYGGATGEEIYAHSQRVLDSVKEKFNVELEREVNII